MINKNIPFTPSSSILDPNGYFVIVTGELYDNNVIFANVYAPNFDDPPPILFSLY